MDHAGHLELPSPHAKADYTDNLAEQHVNITAAALGRIRRQGTKDSGTQAD